MTSMKLVVTANVQVWLDGELLSHVTGFNTQAGWVDQIHIGSLLEGRIDYPIVRRYGKVDAARDPEKEAQ